MNLIVARQDQKLIILQRRNLTGNPLVGIALNQKDIVAIVDHRTAETDEIVVVGKCSQRRTNKFGIRFAIAVNLDILQCDMMRFGQLGRSRGEEVSSSLSV